MEDHAIDDPAIALMALVIHGADVFEDITVTPESAGLLAIADGFALLGLDDQAPAGARATGLRRPLRLGAATGRCALKERWIPPASAGQGSVARQLHALHE